MNTSKFTSYDELPVMLKVNDMANVLGIGLTKAYEISRQSDFPAFNIGTRILIPRDKFLDWIQSKTSEKSSGLI